MEGYKVMNKKSAEELYAEGADYQFEWPELKLGPWTSYSLVNDPKHMCFVLARYKFCAKMLEGKNTVLEVGVGDGFGLPIIAQSVERVYAVDWDIRLLESNARRLAHLTNVTYVNADLNETSLDISFDAAFMIDVIEHVEPVKETTFIENIVHCLRRDGVLIIGTPNVNASQLVLLDSKIQHVNLKSMEALRKLSEYYFENVFMFGMNDEVLHIGHPAMCHYLWSIGCGVRH